MAADSSSMTPTTDTTSLFDVDRHGALIAADASMHLHRFAWDEAIRRAAATPGGTFTADELQAAHGLPDLGNSLGGIFMAAHRAGLIRRVGYRPSEKPSRAGGVVAVWTGARWSE